MSRKSRPRKNPGKKLARVREPAPTDVAAPEQGIVYRLSAESQRTLDAIILGCTFLAQDMIDAPDIDAAPDDFIGFDDHIEDVDYDDIDDVDDDELDAEYEKLAGSLAAVALTTRILARALLAQALGREPKQNLPGVTLPGDDDEDLDGSMLDELARDLLPATAPPVIKQSRAEREAILDDAAFVIQEVGLEEFDVFCELSVLRDGTSELHLHPVSPENAHISIIEFLFNRAEAATVNDDALLAVERDASSWEFACWSVAPPPGTGAVEAGEFARAVREQEYSLVERRTLALGATVVEDLSHDDGVAELFPRQFRMARAYALSVADVYECVSVDGNRVELRSVSDAQTYTVHEHQEPITFAPGWLCVGRLLPFDDGLYLRSPGMLFVRPDGPELVRDAAEALRRYDGVVPPALAVEAVISSVVFGVSVPRPTKPRPSRAHARDTLDLLRELFADTEWESAFTPDSPAPAPIGKLATVPQYYVPRKVDATLDAFVAALVEQAEAGTGGGGREKRRARRSKKARRWR